MHLVHIKPSFSDERGIIAHILELNSFLKMALFITSKAGAIRANHYHKKDSHYTYLLSGKFEYTEKPVANKGLETKIIVPGDLVKTNPMAIHAMKFLEDSSMIVFTSEPRDQKHYEADTVRVKLV